METTQSALQQILKCGYIAKGALYRLRHAQDGETIARYVGRINYRGVEYATFKTDPSDPNFESLEGGSEFWLDEQLLAEHTLEAVAQ